MSVKPSSARKRTKAEQSADTRSLFMQVARQLFAQQSYANTSTEQILAQTSLTRGALYHQFKDKADLLRAVCVQIQQEVLQAISSDSGEADDPYQALLLGCDAFLAEMAKPDVQQILLIDAPSVLGWEEWNQLDRENGFGLLLEGVRAAVATQHLRVSSTEALAIMINGAINEGVSWAVQSEQPTEQLSQVRSTLHQILEGLR